MTSTKRPSLDWTEAFRTLNLRDLRQQHRIRLGRGWKVGCSSLIC